MLKLDWGNILRSRILWIGLACVVGLLLLWYVITQMQACSSTRAIDKAKVAVNAALANLSNAQANLQADKIEEAKRVEDVKVATNVALEAANATQAARSETNKALANLSNAVNANVPVGTTAEDLNKRLEELDK